MATTEIQEIQEQRTMLRNRLRQSEAKLQALRDAACNGGPWTEIASLESGVAALHVQIREMDAQIRDLGAE